MYFSEIFEKKKERWQILREELVHNYIKTLAVYECKDAGSCANWIFARENVNVLMAIQSGGYKKS